MKWTEIDGSMGEGGGQVLRSALSLSCILGEPVRIVNIRRGRSRPGLAPQHLAAVRALARISGAAVRGAELGSTEVSFVPGQTAPGDYLFEIGTAGSVTLLLQCLLPPLLFAPRPSRLVLAGGTHVPFSPPVDYLQEVFFPFLEAIAPGARLECEIDRYGFYPRGGGKVTASVAPSRGVRGIFAPQKGAILSVGGRSCVANLPLSIAKRQRDAAAALLSSHSPAITTAAVPSFGRGTYIFIAVKSETAAAGFSALGAPGKAAEEIGREAATEALAYIGSPAAFDPRLADQIVLYLALAKERSFFSTSRVTNHLVTHLELVRRILGTPFELAGKVGEPGTVALSP